MVRTLFTFRINKLESSCERTAMSEGDGRVAVDASQVGSSLCKRDRCS